MVADLNHWLGGEDRTVGRTGSLSGNNQLVGRAVSEAEALGSRGQRARGVGEHVGVRNQTISAKAAEGGNTRCRRSRCRSGKCRTAGHGNRYGRRVVGHGVVVGILHRKRWLNREVASVHKT